MAKKKYRRVAVGGTFDRFHEGHQKLIDKAFAIGDEILIGVTSDEFGGAKGNIEPCSVRMSNLRKFLKEGEGYEVVRLNEPYGPTINNEDIDALVVSKETEPTARKINQIRNEKGMKPIHIVTIGMVMAEDGKPISSTRIREGKINKKGEVL
jgi:pantetheine-phosphate adenylyltransferase